MAEVVSQVNISPTPEAQAPGVSFAGVGMKPSALGAFTERITPLLAAQLGKKKEETIYAPAITDKVVSAFQQYLTDNPNMNEYEYQRVITEGRNTLRKQLAEAGIKSTEFDNEFKSFEQSFLKADERFVKRNPKELSFKQDIVTGSIVSDFDPDLLQETLLFDLQLEMPKEFAAIENEETRNIVASQWIDLSMRNKLATTQANLATSVVTKLTKDAEQNRLENTKISNSLTREIVTGFVANFSQPVIAPDGTRKPPQIIQQVQSGVLSPEEAKAIVRSSYTTLFTNSDVMLTYSTLGLDANAVSKEYEHIVPTIESLIDANDPSKKLDRDLLTQKMIWEEESFRTRNGLPPGTRSMLQLAPALKDVSLSYQYLDIMSRGNGVESTTLLGLFSQNPGLREFAKTYPKIDTADFNIDVPEDRQALIMTTVELQQALLNIQKGYVDMDKPQAPTEKVLGAVKLFLSNPTVVENLPPAKIEEIKKQVKSIRSIYAEHPRGEELLEVIDNFVEENPQFYLE